MAEYYDTYLVVQGSGLGIYIKARDWADALSIAAFMFPDESVARTTTWIREP